MSPLEVLVLLEQQLDDHGLSARGWRGGLDGAVQRFGCCHQGSRRITVSRHLAALNSYEEVLDTILHEIAHALALIEHGEDCGHDPRWQAIARRIGARPERCFDTTEVVVPSGEYLLVHRDTGEVFRSYHRRPRAKNLDKRWIRGRRAETEGRLVIVSAAEHEAAGAGADGRGGEGGLPAAAQGLAGGAPPFDREGAHGLTKRITAAVEAVCGEAGVRVELEANRFDPTTLRCTFAVRREGVDDEAEEREAFARECAFFLFSADAYGKDFEWNGKRFILCGIKPRSPKYPIIGRDATGRRFKFPLAAVEHLRLFQQ